MLPDAIDTMAGIAPGSRLDAVRARHPVARANAQASHLALFQPDDTSHMTLEERLSVALFVALLHQSAEAAAFYATGLATAPLITQAAAANAATGPTGHYPAGPLSAEDTSPPGFTRPANLPNRLAAALAHAHFLVFHPRDSAPERLQALLDAGWSTTGIVTLSQLVSFLAFQIRVVAGLRVLNAA